MKTIEDSSGGGIALHARYAEHLILNYCVKRDELAQALLRQKPAKFVADSDDSMNRHRAAFVTQLYYRGEIEASLSSYELSCVRVGVINSKKYLRIGCCILKGKNATAMREWALRK